jgi:hypothetical protein
MNSVASLPAAERIILFQETAQRRGLAPLIIEKDFWVCWTLKQLFDLPAGQHLLFKGGTSLSKVFGVIKRFSEDIDLSISRESLGFGAEQEPEAAPSKKQAQQRIEQLQQACIQKIATELLPSLRKAFGAILGDVPSSDAGEPSWRVDQDTTDPQTLLFTYPSQQNTTLLPASYLRPVVRIELGARSDHWPAGLYPLMPYAAEEFPDYFEAPTCHVKTLEVERTFWEKATILHAEHFRPDASATADRISRHYYDLYQMANSAIAERALARVDLLKRVAEHKRVFFRSAWARYEEACPGSLRLIPPEERLPALRVDYDKMGEMFFERQPSFEQLLDVLQKLEKRINGQNC